MIDEDFGHFSAIATPSADGKGVTEVKYGKRCDRLRRRVQAWGGGYTSLFFEFGAVSTYMYIYYIRTTISYLA